MHFDDNRKLREMAHAQKCTLKIFLYKWKIAQNDMKIVTHNTVF